MDHNCLGEVTDTRFRCSSEHAVLWWGSNVIWDEQLTLNYFCKNRCTTKTYCVTKHVAHKVAKSSLNNWWYFFSLVTVEPLQWILIQYSLARRANYAVFFLFSNGIFACSERPNMRTFKWINGNFIMHSHFIDWLLFHNAHEKQVALISGYGGT